MNRALHVHTNSPGTHLLVRSQLFQHFCLAILVVSEPPKGLLNGGGSRAAKESLFECLILLITRVNRHTDNDIVRDGLPGGPELRVHGCELLSVDAGQDEARDQALCLVCLHKRRRGTAGGTSAMAPHR